MPLRRLVCLLPHLFLFLLLCAAGTAARAGDTYTFAGNTVNGCTLSAKTYTCPALPLPNWDDKVVISGGYTVTANGDVTFGYDQGLAISGGGTLKISGNLNIGEIRTSLLQVNGATLVAGKTFSMGAQVQTIVADISAATMNLGTGSQTKITGKIAATGAVNIASNTTIAGPISGTTIVTNSPVSLTGDVTATQAFTLASGSTMKGNVKAGVVNLLASGIQLTGNVTATTSLQMGSGNTITGDVVTGELTLDSSNATIIGNATVNHATLNWAGRVTETIYCAAGNTPGQCDCVTNNSGWDIRKNAKSNAQGPYCEGKTGPLDHFVISHDPTASVCAPTSVTVTACGNASCSTLYTAGTSVTLNPSGQQISIGASGAATAAVTMPRVGDAQLTLVNAAGSAPPTSCRYTVGGAASNCAVKVGDVGFAMSVLSPDNQDPKKNVFFANADNRDATRLKIAALKYNTQTDACVPLFAGTNRQIALSFAPLDPASGQAAPIVAGHALPKTLGIAFDPDGVATPSLSYPDVGTLQLTATYAEQGSSVKSSITAVAAPYALAVGIKLDDKRAGSQFTATVEGRNKAGAKTPSFGAEAKPVIAKLAGTICRPASGVVRLSDLDKATVSQGVETFRPTMLEAGSVDLIASVTGYLDSGLSATGTTNTLTGGQCSGAVGLFTPAYFSVIPEPDWYRTTGPQKLKQYYSGEAAIRLKLTALNLQGSTTVNYMKDVAHDVKLEAIVLGDAGAATVAGLVSRSGTVCASISAHPVCAEEFDNGVASTGGTGLWGKGSYKLPTPASAPLTAYLRATDTVNDAVSSAGAHAVGKGEQQIVIRQGRVRLSNVYGSSGKSLSMPVNIEYWTGSAWTRNVDDTPPTTQSPTFAAASFDVTGMAGTKPSSVSIKNGVGTLTLTPSAGRGTATVALNLGATTPSPVPDTNCYVQPNQKNVTQGANAPYLRARDAYCPAAAEPPDPWARASFGIFTPENRRIIHVREVFR